MDVLLFIYDKRTPNFETSYIKLNPLLSSGKILRRSAEAALGYLTLKKRHQQ